MGLAEALPNPYAPSSSSTARKPSLEFFKSAATASAAPEIKSAKLPPRKEILLGHIVCTLSANPVVRDADMDMPTSWGSHPSSPSRPRHLQVTAGQKTSDHSESVKTDENKAPSSSSPAGSSLPPAKEESPHPSQQTSTSSAAQSSSPVRGHNQLGRTICVHSLAILPDVQGRGFGRLLMQSFIHRFKEAGVADRIALLAHDELVPFYEKLGFALEGKSEATFGGGNWNDMVRLLRFVRLLIPQLQAGGTNVPSYRSMSFLTRPRRQSGR